jgi:hypothetical protein
LTTCFNPPWELFLLTSSVPPPKNNYVFVC